MNCISLFVIYIHIFFLYVISILSYTLQVIYVTNLIYIADDFLREKKNGMPIINFK